MLLTRRVDLHVDAKLLVTVLLEPDIARGPLAPPLVQESSLLLRVHALDRPKTSNIPSKGNTFVGLQDTNEVPADARGEDAGFLEELLDVILTEVEVGVGEVDDWGSIEGDDIGDGLVFGDGDNPDLFAPVGLSGSGSHTYDYLREVGEEGGHSGRVGGHGDRWRSRGRWRVSWSCHRHCGCRDECGWVGVGVGSGGGGVGGGGVLGTVLAGGSR